MAKQPQDGGGTSVLPTAAQHDATRRAAKARQRANSGNGGKTGARTGTSSWLSHMNLDEVRARAATRDAERETQHRQWVYEGAYRCLLRAAQDPKRWTALYVVMAADYLRALAGLSDNADEILQAPGLPPRREGDLRRYFAGAIARAKYPPKNTPGQLAEWFPAELAKARADVERRAAEREQLAVA